MVLDTRDIIQMTALGGTLMSVQAFENNANGQPVYIGYAEAGTAKTAPKWQIRKITYDANNFITDIQFASGTANFDKIWNSRDTYTYS